MDNFVSRAGEKLQYALDNFHLSVTGLVVADFGSSTGGFVDCLLQNKAKKVYAVDTSYGELAWKLRNDKRVVVNERTNAMHFVLPEKVDLITIDTSWTRQEKIIPNALANLKPEGMIISLIKPHYELKKAKLTPEEAETVLARVKQEISDLGVAVKKTVKSPVLGEKGGNTEYLALISPV